MAGKLSEERRMALTLRLMRHVVKTCVKAGIRGLAVSPDARALDVARGNGYDPVYDDVGSLDGAVTKGLGECLRMGADTALVVASDLPLLSEFDIEAACMLLTQCDAVLCPNLTMDGTNILGLRLPTEFTPQYGPGSFGRHLRQLRQHGLRVKTFVSLGTALDVDTPRDLSLARRFSTSSSAF